MESKNVWKEGRKDPFCEFGYLKGNREGRGDVLWES